MTSETKGCSITTGRPLRSRPSNRMQFVCRNLWTWISKLLLQSWRSLKNESMARMNGQIDTVMPLVCQLCSKKPARQEALRAFVPLHLVSCSSTCPDCHRHVLLSSPSHLSKNLGAGDALTQTHVTPVSLSRNDSQFESKKTKTIPFENILKYDSDTFLVFPESFISKP